MRVAVTGSSGLIAGALMPRLAAAGHEIVRLVRREPRGPDEVPWDPTAGDASGVDLDRLAGVDAAVHLAGANVGGRRWSDSYKRTILGSRVLGTRTLVSALAALDDRPAVLVSGSAVGYYGSRGDEVLTESSSRGDGFLADVTDAWEAEAVRAEDAGIRTVLARTGLVMSDSGGAFGRLLPIFSLGLGGRIGDGQAWWPWITLEDEARALAFCLTTDSLSGPVNLSAPEPARNAEVTKALAAAMRRPAVLPVPTVALRLGLGEFAEDVTSSQRMVPAALLAADFEFRHADLASACRWLVTGASH